MSSEEDDDLDYMLKIVVIGALAAYLRRLRGGQDQSDLQVHQRKVQRDFQADYWGRFFAQDNTGRQSNRKSSVLGHCWPRERYRSITTSFYKSSAGCILVYDITQRTSFQNLKGWLKDVKDYNDESLKVMLVGNKADLEEEREVTTEEAKQFAEQEKLYFMEVSALTNKDDNVSKAFVTLVEEIVNNKENEPDPEEQKKPVPVTSQSLKTNAVVALKKENNQEKKTGCC